MHSPGSRLRYQADFYCEGWHVLQFNWQYLTDDGCDFAFVVLDGNILLLADVTAVTHDSDTLFLLESAYRTFVVSLAIGGTHTIGIGVVDTLDSIGNSGVLLDNFRIVPESRQFSSVD